jgi:ferredoxin
VQCGLCATTCPEDAITLQPRLLLTPQRKEARVLNEAKPYHCIRCAKPFGTLKAIESMLGKLAGHRCSRAPRRAPQDVRRLPRHRHVFRRQRSRITDTLMTRTRRRHSASLTASTLDEETARAEVYGLLAALYYAAPAAELL